MRVAREPCKLCPSTSREATITQVAARMQRFTIPLHSSDLAELGRHSPPEIGGVAAPSRKKCEATATAQTGWSGLPKCFGMRFLEQVPLPTTPSAPSKEASRLLFDVASTPPIS